MYNSFIVRPACSKSRAIINALKWYKLLPRVRSGLCDIAKSISNETMSSVAVLYTGHQDGSLEKSFTSVSSLASYLAFESAENDQLKNNTIILTPKRQIHADVLFLI